MDSDGRNSFLARPDPTGSINTPRHLENVAESEWFQILAQIISATLLFILIFGMSATVDIQHLREQVHNKFAILTGVATQFLIMPLLGYVSVVILGRYGLTDPMAVSLLIVTASPGGSYSNWWCSMFNADLALSVTMTAISTMVSVIMLPANLLLYVNAAFGLRESGGDDGGTVLDKIDWASLFVSLAIVVAAIALGLCASLKISSHRFNRFANRMGSLSGILLIVFSGVVSSLSGSNEAQVWGQPWSFYVGVSAPCLVGLVIATLCAAVARLRKPEVITVGVECCYQNVGIATSAAVAMFDDPVERGQALCVPLFYGLMEAIVLGIYCIIGWKFGWTKAPSDGKFCVVIATTYEVDDDENESEIDLVNHMDEENPEVRDSSGVDSESRRGSWPLFRQRKRKPSDETGVSSASPPKRRSMNESLAESISQIDAITDLVQFPQKQEYARCRINSEEGTAVTDVSNTSTSSPSNSSTAGTPRPHSIMTGTF
mmetsp:Transcript_17156/g.30819  ORF Transcript_17156/g.30819 Transcript_17156/m.30819 type:complete len:489 (+) Transcript_17156:250-1716(+)